MAQLYTSGYDTTWTYGEDVVPLFGFNFTVTDSVTGAPIQGALCVIYAGLDGTGDADTVYTDSQGIAGIDAKWFAPRSWSVSKAGYLQTTSNNVVSSIPVALVPTTVMYTVRVLAGLGGTTEPSGTLTVNPDTQLTVRAIPNSGYILDHWVYKGENVGATNPLTFIIDRNAITISAVFKQGVPPPNGEPPNGEPPTEWPIVKTDHVFDNVRLDPGLLFQVEESKEKTVDTSQVLGGQIDYSVKLEAKIPTTGCTYYIILNNEILFEEGFPLWAVPGDIKSGVLNIPLDKIRSTNLLTIALSQLPGTFNRCLFNVYVTLGYREDPEDPPWKEESLLEWLWRNAWWITLGSVGTLLTGAIVLGYIVELGEKK